MSRRGRRLSLSSRSGFRVSEIPGGLAPEQGWIELVRPGKHDSGYEGGPLRLRSDAFLDVAEDKGAAIKYYKNGHWNTYVTSD